MKLTIALTLACMFAAHAGSYSQGSKLNLSIPEASIVQVLKEIESQSGFYFFYNEEELKQQNSVALNVENKSIQQVLDLVLQNTGLTYRMIDRYILISKNEQAGQLPQQPKTVSGKVTDSSSVPLPGVSVVIKGTTTGTITDATGSYSLNHVPGDATLIFSFVGMRMEEVVVGGQPIISVVLEEETIGIEEVVAIGYGSLEKNRMTTSVSKVDVKRLENIPLSNVATALAGAIPGLRVQNTTGQPGATPTIVLRGGTSWQGGGTPLVLIDGIIGSFDAVSSQDIESIEVLKDAASTSIYGARAANGVIMITTKKGRKGDARISYSYTFGINEARKGYDYLNAEDYIRINRLGWQDYVELTGRTNFNTYIVNPAIGWTATGNIDNSIYTTQYLTSENEFLLDQGWKKMEDPLYGKTIAGMNFNNQYIIFQDNKMSELPYKTGNVNEHHLSVTGGGDKATYAAGIGYLKDEGTIHGSSYERLSGNINADYRITDNVKVSSIMNFTSSSRLNTYIGEGTIAQRIMGQPPTSRLYNSDGSINPGLSEGFGNPLYYADKFKQENLDQRLRTSLALEWNILSNLKLGVKGSYYNINSVDEAFNKAFMSGGNLNVTRQASAIYTRNQTFTGNAILDYFVTFKENHSIRAMIGSEYYTRNYFRFGASTKYSPTDLIPTLNVGSEASGVPYSLKNMDRMLSAFGRLNYDYKLKYLVQLNFRYDGSSKLADNKWGFFPGVSAGWNAHKEVFFKNAKLSKYVSSLKPRISYGVNGNVDDLTEFGVYGEYGLSPIYQSEKGYYLTSLPTLGLKWESSTTFDMGVDLGLFSDEVNLTAEYFIRDVKNKISNYDLPYWTGFSNIRTNIGTLRNKGFEVEINANIINHTGDGFKWNIGVIAHTAKNYVVKLPDNGLPNNRQGGTQIYNPKSGQVEWVGGLQEGKRVGLDLVYGHVQETLYNAQEQLDEDANVYDAYHFAENARERFLGNVKWLDVDKNDSIDYRDRVIIGRYTPQWMGGVTTSLSYKGFELYVKTDYAIGHTIHNENRARSLGQVQGSQNIITEVLDAWRPDHTDTDVPRFVFVDAFKDNGVRGINDRTNTRLLEKADYLCIREVTFSYNLPQKIIGKHLNSLKVYTSGTNLFYFTKYSGFAPEAGGTDGGRYPLPVSITFGVNVNF